MLTNLLKVSYGGAEIRASAILLHSASGVRLWQSKVAEAQNLIGGIASGIGLIGSPEFVLAGATAIGILETVVKNANQKKGLQILSEAAEFHERLISRGEWVPIQKIAGISRPHPGSWTAETEIEGEVDLTNLGMFERSKIMSDWNISKEEAKAGFVYRRSRQKVMFLPDEFVWLNGEAGPTAVRWSTVTSYSLKP